MILLSIMDVACSTKYMNKNIRSIGGLLDFSSLKKHMRNVGLLFLDRFVRIVISLTVGVWVARYLGPRDFGVLSYSLSFLAILSVLVRLGLHDILVREFVHGELASGEVLGTAFALKLVGGFLTIIVVLLVVFFQINSANSSDVLLVLAVSSVFQSLVVLEAFFQSKALYKYTVFSYLVALTIGALLKVCLVVIEAPLLSIAFVYIIESALVAIGLLGFYCGDYRRRKHWRVKLGVGKRLLKSAWPLILSGLFVTVYMKVDQIMISHMLGSERTGEYAAAVRLSEAWYFIPVILVSVAYPSILGLCKSDKDRYQSSFQLLYFVLLLLALFVAMVMTFSSGYLILWLYGDEYSASADVLSVHVWASIFVFLGVAGTKWMLCEGVHVYSMYNTLIGLLINIFLNYFFIGAYGIVGAAWATLISYAFSGYLCFYMFPRIRHNFYLMSCCYRGAVGLYVERNG